MFGFLSKKVSFRDLNFSSDCHSHILPGVDDGSDSIETSIQMLRKMMEIGLKKVVLTPHINPDVYPETNETLIRNRFDDFINDLPYDIKSALQISLGAEYMVTQNFENRDPSQLIRFRPKSVLIEMSYLFPSSNMEQAIFNLVMAGLQPVIAHPERYLYYAHNYGDLERFHDMGAQFQMNLLSLSGTYGSDSLAILKWLLNKGWYSYIGSDAHSLPHMNNVSAMRFDHSLLEKIHSNTIIL